MRTLVKATDIGCKVRVVGKEVGPDGEEVPIFEVTPNNPEVYKQMVEIVRRDVLSYGYKMK